MLARARATISATLSTDIALQQTDPTHNTHMIGSGKRDRQIVGSTREDLRRVADTYASASSCESPPSLLLPHRLKPFSGVLAWPWLLRRVDREMDLLSSSELL